jgi:pSer/pThr/pTyr-binding forkhead associated (FHA) protein
MGEKEPILVEDEPTVTLGRVVFGEPTPTVDLTDFHGRLLGVSRHHAAIHHFKDGYTLEDLNSSNGTYLNDNQVLPDQVTPLHNGDLIRLGQLVLLVHFEDISQRKAAEIADEDRPRTPTRPLEMGTDIRALSVTLVGRPNRVDIRPDGVMTTMLYAPDADSLPEGTPILFTTSRIYSVYIPIKLWKKIEAAFNDPHDELLIDGTCAYDSENGRIAILATAVSSKHLEAKRAHIIARKNRRGDQLHHLIQRLRRR